MRARPTFRSVGLLLGLLLLMWGVGAGGAAHAQRSAASGPTRPLAEALKRLSAAAEVSLVYESALVQGHAVACAVEDTAPEAALRCLLRDTNLDFVQTSGGTYVIKQDVRRPPRTGTVTGVVWDRERDAPLPHVHVQSAEEGVGAVSDADGRFRLEGLVEGPHTLALRRVGYRTRTVERTVRPDAPRRDTVALTPTAVALNPVVVDAPPAPELGPSRSYDTLSPQQLSQTGPLGTPSVAHAAGTLMGVSTTAPYADLHVQGGAEGDHKVRLDGAPVRNPTTAGRLLGAFSPLALDGLTARKAGFGALRGDALSGVVELEHSLERPDTRHATVRVDPVGVNGRAEGTADLGGTTVQLMAAGRVGLWDVHRARSLRSLIDTWSVLDPVLTAAQVSADTALVGGSFEGRQARPRSRFHDVHAAARIEFSPTQRLHLSTYRGRSALGTDLVVGSGSVNQSLEGELSFQDGRGSIELPASDRYAWTNTLVQARYESTMSGRTTGMIRAFLSRYRAASRYDVGRLQSLPNSGLFGDRPAGSRATNAVTEAGLRGALDISLRDRTQLFLSGGLLSLGTRADLTNAFVGPIRHTARRPRLTMAGEAQGGLGAHLIVEGGLRLTARPGSGGVYAEPRAALRYRRSGPTLGDLALRVGGGLYRRFTTQFGLIRDGATAVVPSTQVWTPVPASLEPPRAYHLATNLGWDPDPAWTLGAEGYLKWQPHLLAVDYPALIAGPGPASPSQVLSPSRGRAYGGGLHVSYDGSVGTGTLRYSYSRSRRSFPGRFDDRLVPTPWNEPHRLTLEAQVSLGDVLSVDLRGTGIWDRRWGYRRSYYAYLGPGAPDLPRDGPDFDDPSEHPLPPLYRADAALVAAHSWGDVSVEGRIGLLNVLGRANVADWGLRPAGKETLTRWPRTLPGRRSVVSLTVRY